MKMKAVSGTRIDGRSLPNFTWNADLIAFDGPLLSLFKSDSGIDALFVWLDCSEIRNRWAIIDIKRDNLRDYLNRKLSLLDVFKASTSVTVFDAGPTARKSNLVRTRWSDLPQEYLPKENSFLTEAIATPDAIRLASEQAAKYSIKLDGEIYLDDLAAIPKIYQQLYSFHYGLEHISRAAIKSTIINLLGKWKGGFSAVNLFTGLRSVTPSIHRARIKQLQYNSPGHITMELLPRMAEKIKNDVLLLSDPNNFQLSEELYKAAYKYFRENGIAGFEDERGTQTQDLTLAQLDDLKGFVEEFLVILQWGGYREQFTALEIGPLSQLRALLAYYRRLRKVLSYIELGLIELT